MPGQLVHRAAPDHRRLAAVAEHHDQAVERAGTIGITDIDPAVFDLVCLDLGAGRHLNAPEILGFWFVWVSHAVRCASVSGWTLTS